MDPEHEELLDLIPAFRRGRLSPGKAHLVAQALRDDPEFAREAAREEIVIDALAGMREMPLPKGLVAKSVRAATGGVNPAKWFSLDTLLFALGVGVICAAAAQLLVSWIKPPSVGEWLITIADFAASRPFDLITGVFAVVLVLMGLGTWLTLKALRS